MERYTEKINETDYKLIKYNDIVRACARQKLGKIEDMLKAFNIETLEELEKLLEFATIYEELTNKLGCPLEVFIKLLFEQKIWIEVNGKMYLTENINFSIELELQEDETFINTLEDYGESTFWAWYYTERRSSDHVVLKLKDYKKTWFLKEDRSE